MQHISPTETRPARMRPLEVLPVFMDLAGRRAVVAGSGEALVWKAELLAAAGAHVLVSTSSYSTELAELTTESPTGRIDIQVGPWQEADLDEAAIAVGALAGDEARDFAAAARRRGVPVNIVDTPELSTFSFGTIVNRSPLVVGISTSGVAPVLGQVIRGKIEALLHPALAAWVAAAKRLRASINQRTEMGPARRDAWRRFADAALVARAAPGSDALDALARPAVHDGGSVALVGAGPGDPELLTLKALRALQSADVILYDRLVSPEILELARREARRMLVGKTGHGPSCRQDEISALMVKLARQGRRVVRLKGGDPMIFGRAAEEIEACRAAGIPVEIVPGITAALGAAAELQLPLTDRRAARRLHFVTGHGRDGRAPDHDWASLADPWATTVFYMGTRTFAQMLPHLLAAGLDHDTPALVVSAATTPRRRHTHCRVRTLASAMAGIDNAEPTLILIGRVVAEAGAMPGHQPDNAASPAVPA